MGKKLNAIIMAMMLLLTQQLPMLALETNTDITMQFEDDVVTSTRTLVEDEATNLLIDENGGVLTKQIHNENQYELDEVTITRYRRKVRIEYYVGNYIDSELIGSDEGYADADTSIRGYLFDIEGVNTAFGTNVPTNYKYVNYSATDRTIYSYVPAYDGTDETYVVKALLAEVKRYPVMVSKYQNKQDVQDGDPIGLSQTEIDDTTNTQFWRVNTLSTSFTAVVGQEINLKSVGQISPTYTQRGREGFLRTFGTYDENNRFMSVPETYIAPESNARLPLAVFYDVDDFGAEVVNPGSSSSVTSGANIGFTADRPKWLDETVSETLSINNDQHVEKLQAYPFHLDEDAFDEPEVDLSWLEDNWMLMHKLAITYSYEKIETYTVTFETGPLGSIVLPIKNLPLGSLVKRPVNPSSAGYLFEGWYKDVTHTAPWDFANDKITGNITLYAKWNKDTEVTDPNEKTDPVEESKPNPTEPTTPKPTLPKTGSSNKSEQLAIGLLAASVIIISFSKKIK